MIEELKGSNGSKLDWKQLIYLKMRDKARICRICGPAMSDSEGSSASAPSKEDFAKFWYESERFLKLFHLTDGFLQCQELWIRWLTYNDMVELYNQMSIVIGTKDFKINFWNTVRFLYLNMILMHGYESRRRYSKHNVGHDASPASPPSKDSFRQIW